MNLKYDSKDYFSVLVWTNKDTESRSVRLVETGSNTGIFLQLVGLSPAISSPTKFRVSNNDQIYVTYADKTVPLSVSPTHKLLINSSIPIYFEPVESDSTFEFEPTTEILKPGLDLMQTGTNKLF